jgi:hypothetical protein
MKKALALMGFSSSIVTMLISLLPDKEIGIKVLLFFIFGLVAFGISWALSNVNKLVNGLFSGALFGILIGVCVVTIDDSLPKMANYSGTLNYTIILSLKWIIPILGYTYLGIDPWKNKPIL